MTLSLCNGALGLVALLQVADIVSTNAALSKPGVIEANPLVAVSQLALGEYWFVPKLAIATIGLLLLYRAGKAWPALAALTLYAIVVALNLANLAA
jgi:hypothetical protein